ncbi:MAG: biopolymer transporter ExbD [Pseudomonadota bacterium]
MRPPPALVLKRPRPPKALISLVAMIDVLLILLVFFMVTSTYLDLDLIPAVAQDSDAPADTSTATATAGTLLIRLGESGTPVIRGQEMSLEGLDSLLRERLAADPALSIVILPTGVARMQALISVMDTATQAGARQVRVIRLEGRG